MFLQIQILIIILIMAAYFVMKQQKFPNLSLWLSNFMSNFPSWIRRHIEFLTNLIPVTASILMFIKAYSMATIHDFGDFFEMILGCLFLAAVTYGIVLLAIALTRGAMNKWRGW